MDNAKHILSIWQKKPLLVKNFFQTNSLSHLLNADELAGMALDGISARIVVGNYSQQNWRLLQQPFANDIFTALPEQDWTLLVQGVDRFIPEIHHLIDAFSYIPRWKFDDVMMSYAAIGGSVGPHFDYYDVFLVQTSGTRKWQLSTQYCTENNYHVGFNLRVMQQFESELEYITTPGDMLYIPSGIAHFGTSLSDDCTTLSFGYRAYHSSELAEFVGNKPKCNNYYQDPVWNNNKTPALIIKSAIDNANMLVNISAEEFAEFVTTTNLADEEIMNERSEECDFNQNNTYILHPCLKIAYLENFKTFIAGIEFKYLKQDRSIMLHFCNTREINGNTVLAKQLFELGFLQTKIVK